MTGRSQTRRTPVRTPTARFRPQIETLEGRDVPSTLTVTNNLDTGVAGDGSLRGEIAAAQSGDTIVFDPNLSGQTISLFGDGEMVINKNLTIQGPSAPLSPVTISGDGSRVFEMDGAKTVVSLSNLSFTYGSGRSYASSGGGAPYGQGGAIWNGGTLTISACNLSNNLAINGNLGLGGAIYNAGTLTVSNSTLDNNSVYLETWDYLYVGDGGAIYNAGTLTVSNSTLDGNTATVRGGGDGGGIYNASGATAIITGSSLSGNSAFDGGGIFNAYKASATVTGSSLSGNHTFDGYVDGYYWVNTGGGIYNDGVTTLSGSTISGDSGGIFNDKHGHLTITSMSSVVNSGTDLYNLGAVKISADSIVGVIVN
jgi:hypothetical protein